MHRDGFIKNWRPSAYGARYKLSGGRWFQAAYLVGLSAVGLALYCLLIGQWVGVALGLFVGALLLWLCGKWSLPWGRQTYLKETDRILADWIQGVELVDSSYLEQRARLTTRLNELLVPGGFEEESKRINALLSISYGQASFIEQVHQSLTDRQTVAQIQDWLVSQATTDEQQRYITTLEAILKEHRVEYAATRLEIEKVTRRIVAKLSDVEPPNLMVEDHEKMTKAFNFYAKALQEFNIAYETHDNSELTKAAESLHKIYGQLTASWVKYRA